MDGITRKRMKCDCHIAKKGYFGWKKIGEALGMGKGLYTGIPDYLPFNYFGVDYIAPE